MLSERAREQTATSYLSKALLRVITGCAIVALEGCRHDF